MNDKQLGKLGRNAPCHCGSGRKYKKCCLSADQQAARDARYREEHWEDETWESLPDESGPDPDEPEADQSDLHWPPVRSYPQPPELPDPDDKMALVVDAWWEHFMPVYKARDVDAILETLDAAIEQRPEIVPYLGLEQEFLTEFQGIMIRGERRPELIDRLLRLRTEAPEVYDQVHGYLDTTLAASLIALGRADEVGGVLDRFVKYPDANPDCLAEMLDILLVADRQDDVLALARATAAPCACSEEVMGMGPSLAWLTFEVTTPVYDRHGYSTQDAADLVAAHDQLDLPFPHTMTKQRAQDLLADSFAPMDWTLPGLCGDRDHFLDRLSATFWVWLHDVQGLSWVSAAFFSNRVRDLHFLAPPEGMTFRNPLNPCVEAVESYIVQNCKRMFHLYGLHAFSLLQTLHWFADFLEAQDQSTPVARDELRETCRTLYGKLCGAVHPTDNGLALFGALPQFASLRFSENPTDPRQAVR